MFIPVYIHIHTMCFPWKGKYKRTFSACIHTTLNETRALYPLSAHRGNISSHIKPVFKCMLHNGQRRGLLWRKKGSTIIRSGSLLYWGMNFFFPGFFFFSPLPSTQKRCKRWLEYKMRIYDNREDDVLIRLKNSKITFFPLFLHREQNTEKKGGYVSLITA